MVAYYDRGRDNISRNSTHAVAAWIEGAVWPLPCTARCKTGSL
jgi:hypothetical protein